MADLAIRVDRIEEDIKDHQVQLDETHDRLDVQSDTIQSIEQWRKGNGAQGAEARLQCVEEAAVKLAEERIGPRLNIAEADIQALQKIADGKLTAVVGETVKSALDARDKTAIAYVKAFSPYAVALAAILVAVFK